MMAVMLVNLVDNSLEGPKPDLLAEVRTQWIATLRQFSQDYEQVRTVPVILASRATELTIQARINMIKWAAAKAYKNLTHLG